MMSYFWIWIHFFKQTCNLYFKTSRETHNASCRVSLRSWQTKTEFYVFEIKTCFLICMQTRISRIIFPANDSSCFLNYHVTRFVLDGRLLVPPSVIYRFLKFPPVFDWCALIPSILLHHCNLACFCLSVLYRFSPRPAKSPSVGKIYVRVQRETLRECHHLRVLYLSSTCSVGLRHF